MNKKIFLLLTIGIILTRFLGLTKIPLALNRDEAAIGWNAYSILKTAKDEHGQFLPLNFKSIGDYKMPLYIYASVLPIKIFGLNEFSVRFWSSLAGGISVFTLYFLSLEFFKSKKTALLSSILLLFNPWAVFYSRIAFEANLALALFLLGTLFILKEKLIIGFLLYLLSSLTYSSSLILIPFFCLTLLIFNKNLRNKKHYLSWSIFSLLFSLIFIVLYKTSSQKSTISIISNPTIIDTYNQLRTEIYANNPVLAKLWYNKPLYLLRMGLTNYFKTFSLKFLIQEGGGHPWHRVLHLGNFYTMEIILSLTGLITLLKSKLKSKKNWILLSWLLISPLASAITIDAPHSTRSLFLLPIIVLLASHGVTFLLKEYKGYTFKVLLITSYFLSVTYGIYRYTITYPKFFPQDIPVGLKQALEFVADKKIDGKIYLTNIDNSTYLYPVFHQQQNPKNFQQEATWSGENSVGLSNAHQFGNYYIVNNLNDIKDPQAIILPTKETSKLFDSLKLGYQNSYYQVLIKEK